MVILAGGKSSRMKQDKALLPFGGYNSLSEYQYKKFASSFSSLYISSKENKFDFDVNLIFDKYEESSPLVSIVSIFETVRNLEEVFILSVDAPFITQEIVNNLYHAVDEKYDVIVAKSINGLEPLCAIYKRTVLEEAKKMLSSNQHRLQTLLASLSIKEVFFNEEKAFLNMNYPQEYIWAKLFSSNI